MRLRRGPSDDLPFLLFELVEQTPGVQIKRSSRTLLRGAGAGAGAEAARAGTPAYISQAGVYVGIAVAMVFDDRGRMYVPENRGYPIGPAAGEPPVGRIALLEDTDGDGRMDRRAEFARGLTFPNGVMAWGGGLIVTCAPDVLF